MQAGVFAFGKQKDRDLTLFLQIFSGNQTAGLHDSNETPTNATKGAKYTLVTDHTHRRLLYWVDYRDPHQQLYRVLTLFRDEAIDTTELFCWNYSFAALRRLGIVCPSQSA
ncbi:MAG: hypothetical protein PHF70_00055 [Opitutales bacterium]|nr:hypothetical protein [Opitutales bacterium]